MAELVQPPVDKLPESCDDPVHLELKLNDGDAKRVLELAYKKQCQKPAQKTKKRVYSKPLAPHVKAARTLLGFIKEFSNEDCTSTKKGKAFEQAALYIKDDDEASNFLELEPYRARSVRVQYRTDKEVSEQEKSIFQEHNSDAMSALYDPMNEMPLQGEIMTSTTHGWDDQLGVPDLDKEPYSVNREDIDNVVLDSAEALDGVKFHW